MTLQKRPRYGADRPDLTVLSSIGAAFWIALGVFLYSSSLLSVALRGAALAVALAVGFSCLFLAATFLASTRITKFRQRDSLLDNIDWNGVQNILDVGCGPGLLLIGAAKRAPHAKAFGVDIWQKRVESGNKAERTLENAKLEGVAERIEVQNGDVRTLPFSESKFDVVLSRAVLHNLKGKKERQKAIAEIIRVLRPNGQVGLIIVDSWHLDEYLDLLRQGGMSIQKVSKPPRFFPPGLMLLAMILGRKS